MLLESRKNANNSIQCKSVNFLNVTDADVQHCI